MDSVFVSLGEQLYCGSELRPKNFSEVERLSGAEKRRELEATASLLGRVCVHVYVRRCDSDLRVVLWDSAWTA